MDLRLDLRIPDDALLAARARALGLTGRDGIMPGERVPLIRGPRACQPARWGWPATGGVPGHAHVRIAVARVLPEGERAWRYQRGVVPVRGWQVDDLRVAAADGYLAALWLQEDDGLCTTILTQPAPRDAAAGGWFPIALDAAAALAWIAAGDSEAFHDARLPVLAPA